MSITSVTGAPRFDNLSRRRKRAVDAPALKPIGNVKRGNVAYLRAASEVLRKKEFSLRIGAEFALRVLAGIRERNNKVGLIFARKSAGQNNGSMAEMASRRRRERIADNARAAVRAAVKRALTRKFLRDLLVLGKFRLVCFIEINRLVALLENLLHLFFSKLAVAEKAFEFSRSVVVFKRRVTVRALIR